VEQWWQRDVLAAGKLPLMLCFVAFVLTFIVTRTVTRLIRAGRGPFHDHVTAGGTHVHHAVPGLALLIVGAFLSVGAQRLLFSSIAAVLVGVGVSLVLDEFALILHLSDVYWTAEGRISVQVASLAAACLGLALVGFSPLGVDDVGGIELGVRLGAVAALGLNAGAVLVCVAKGKYRLAVFGAFLPPIAVAGAIRLARPRSRWARRHYSVPRRLTAQRRSEAFDQRWSQLLIRYEDLVGGAIDPPEPRSSDGADQQEADQQEADQHKSGQLEADQPAPSPSTMSSSAHVTGRSSWS
jgi:hypothetical protein